VARMATCFDCTVMCWTILELVWIFFGHRFLWTMNSSGFERCIRVRTCMIMLVHSIGCILIFLNCYFVDRPLSLSWCALCLQLIRFCRTLTMGLPQFGSVPPLYYDLVSCGLRCVTSGPFSTCTIALQHWKPICNNCFVWFVAQLSCVLGLCLMALDWYRRMSGYSHEGLGDFKSIQSCCETFCILLWLEMNNIPTIRI